MGVLDDGATLLTHGTRACYKHGCHCDACTQANTAYIAHLRRQHAYGRTPLGAHVDAKEAWRLIRKLKIERFENRDIAKAFGLKRPRLELHTDAITFRNLLKVRRLYRTTLCGDANQPNV